MITILLVDDHPVVRSGIKCLLETVSDMKIVGEAATGGEALRLAKALNPKVVLMDIAMPGLDGLETTRRMVRFQPHIKIIIISIFSAGHYPYRLLEAGAMGYLSKNCVPRTIIKAVRMVMTGQHYISPLIANQLGLQHVSQEPDRIFDILSLREFQIGLMLLKGKKIKEIAEAFFVSEKTIMGYRCTLFKKLNIHNEVQLILLAKRVGLLDFSIH